MLTGLGTGKLLVLSQIGPEVAAAHCNIFCSTYMKEMKGEGCLVSTKDCEDISLLLRKLLPMVAVTTGLLRE
jgi:hypothetical protein